MTIKNPYMNSFTLTRDAIVNGEHLSLTIDYRFAPEDQWKRTGWIVSIETHDPETDEIDWGFCSDWCPTYAEAISQLKANVSYKTYPFPC